MNLSNWFHTPAEAYMPVPVFAYLSFADISFSLHFPYWNQYCCWFMYRFYTISQSFPSWWVEDFLIVSRLCSVGLLHHLVLINDISSCCWHWQWIIHTFCTFVGSSYKVSIISSVLLENLNLIMASVFQPCGFPFLSHSNGGNSHCSM